MPSIRSVSFSLLVGLVHAAGLLAVALELGYAVGPAEYSIPGMAWRYGGLVVVAAVPVWLAVRYRLVVPLVAVLLTSGYVVGMELTPPGPTFRDVAELEGLAEPTGYTVVENGLYIVRYMVNASVWTVGFLFAGVVEAAVRSLWDRLPPVDDFPSWLSVPADRREAATVAAGGGVLHAVAMTWFAYRLGVTVSGGFAWLLYGYGAIGMWLLAAVPLYLLYRHRLLAPVTLMTAFVLLNARAEFTASVEDPHTLYFGAWFLYLGLVLVTAGIEYGLHRVDAARRVGSLL
ncbi:hypothetical protein [Natronomonas amylolytica]|uniref:hypothetical protein n=1 Tax=Natronomonas amylolytica TaxID=3108498 RepID=UPI00300B8381